MEASVHFDWMRSWCRLCWAPNVCVCAEALVPDITAPCRLCEPGGRQMIRRQMKESFILLFLSPLLILQFLCLWRFGGPCQKPDPVWCHTWITGSQCCHWHTARQSVSIPIGSSAHGYCGGTPGRSPCLKATCEQMRYWCCALDWEESKLIEQGAYDDLMHVRLWGVIIMSHLLQFCTGMLVTVESC